MTDARLDWLRRMYEIRFFEDEVQALFTQGLVGGSTHLCQGQEAVSVGACSALEDGDTMTCTYRGHGAVLAMGAPLDRTFAEILGRADGLCGGKGGSMHLTDAAVGALGSFAVVGAHLPIANGLALAEVYLETGRVTLCFFGDGSTNIGAFHEALNLAQVWRLPAIFLCENNLYGEYSPIARTTPIEVLADRADSYAMRKARIDGNVVGEVHGAVMEAAAAARAGDGPTFIEALTYRHKGHSRTDPATYRPEGELDAWLERDPITLLREAVANDGTDESTLDDCRGAAAADVQSALERARSWPAPGPDARFDQVLT
jgi:TPP-dependent pyruvate/acetoin dehydrogenase alpha subunit